MIVVGMSGFVLGPLLGGTALAHVRWEWLVVNAPIAIACIGVRLGVPVDRPEDLTNDALDLPGAALSISTIGLASLVADQRRAARLGLRDHDHLDDRRRRGRRRFIWHERRTPAPMLDLDLFSTGTVRAPPSPRSGRPSRWPA
jgi:MFS family permease